MLENAALVSRDTALKESTAFLGPRTLTLDSSAFSEELKRLMLLGEP